MHIRGMQSSDGPVNPTKPSCSIGVGRALVRLLKTSAHGFNQYRFWEPQAKRVQEMLIKRYLRARGIAVKITSQFRDAYWLAAACNGLSGALRYHLLVMCDEQRSRHEQCGAARASADWLRVIRHADACIRI